MDFALNYDDQTGWDIGATDGDFARDELGLDSAIKVSLLCDRRAANDDEIDNDYRGGVWHDAWPEFQGDLHGSRLYLLRRRLQNNDTLQDARVYAEEALQWLLVNKIATAVTVTTEWLRDGVLSIRIIITLANGDDYQQSVNYFMEAA